MSVCTGDEVEPGDALVDGPRDTKELPEIRGTDATQGYLVAEVPRVCRGQGISTHDKHIELIVRQKTKRVAIGGPADTRFLSDEQYLVTAIASRVETRGLQATRQTHRVLDIESSR